jgi:hypothetical protein
MDGEGKVDAKAVRRAASKKLTELERRELHARNMAIAQFLIDSNEEARMMESGPNQHPQASEQPGLLPADAGTTRREQVRRRRPAPKRREDRGMEAAAEERANGLRVRD